MASNFAEAMQQGYAFGAQQREDRERRSKLAELAGLSSKVIGGDYEATNRAYALDPQAAKTYQSEGDRRREQLAGMARGWKSVPSEQRQAYYERFIAPAVSQMGFGDLGPYDEAAVDGVATQILAAYGGGKAQNPYEGLPSDIQSLKLLQSDPTLAALDRERRQAAGMVPKLVETNQGIGWGTPGAGINLAPIEGVAGGTQQAPAQAPQLFAALGQKYGIQPTSVTRTPERNRQVGGVANSYHLTGQAADFVVPQAQKAQFIQDARQNGYEAIDEGDHIHIEPAGRGGGGAPNIAQPYQKQDAPPAGFRRTADGNLEFIPGGPADPFVKNEVTGAQRAKLAATKQKEQQLLRANEAGIDQTIALIDSILSRKGDFGGVTGMGAMGARIPGTKWADLAAALDTLRGRSAFGALQQMRANSPTGGALGSVTERELGLLQNSETQLQNTQSPEALANGLEAYKRVLQETKRRMREGLDEFYQDSGSAPSGSQSGWSIQRVD